MCGASEAASGAAGLESNPAGGDSNPAGGESKLDSTGALGGAYGERPQSWAARIVNGLAGFRFFAAEAAAGGEPRGPFDGTSPTCTASDLGLCSAGGAPNGGSKNGLPDPAHAGGEPTARAVGSRPPGARVVAVVGSKCLSDEPVASMASRATTPTLGAPEPEISSIPPHSSGEVKPRRARPLFFCCAVRPRTARGRTPRKAQKPATTRQKPMRGRRLTRSAGDPVFESGEDGGDGGDGGEDGGDGGDGGDSGGGGAGGDRGIGGCDGGLEGTGGDPGGGGTNGGEGGGGDGGPGGGEGGRGWRGGEGGGIDGGGEEGGGSGGGAGGGGEGGAGDGQNPQEKSQAPANGHEEQ